MAAQACPGPARVLLERSKAPFWLASASPVRSKWPLKPAPLPPMRSRALKTAAQACPGAANALAKAGLACCSIAHAAQNERSGLLWCRQCARNFFELASVPSVHSNRLFEPAVRDHYSKVLVSVTVCPELLHSSLHFSKHGMYRVGAISNLAEGVRKLRSRCLLEFASLDSSDPCSSFCCSTSLCAWTCTGTH